MPVYSIGRERESLMYSGEAFKNAIRKYLESFGYSETTDSYIEGHLPDMIFYNIDIDPGREFWIEAKASKISLSNKGFCKEVLDLLRIWLDLGTERRFKLKIFVQEVFKRRKWNLIFGEPIDKEFVDEWLSKNKSLISDDEWGIINGTLKEDIYSFFQEIEVFIAPAYRLEIAAEDKQKISLISPTRKAKALLEESERRNHLIEKRNNLIIDLMKIELPKTYVKIKSKCKRIDEIWEKASGSILPPFAFDGSNIYSFCSIEDLDPLKKLISGNPEYFETQELLLNNPQELVRLVNFHIDKLVRCRGLRKHRDIYFPLPIISEEGEIKERIVRSQTGRDRRIVRPIFEIIDSSKLYYVYHLAVKVSSKILWGDSYISIIPTRHFTIDGKTPIEGDHKDRLDRKYRNPIYNRSETYLSQTLFWKYYLFDRQFNNPQISSWLNNFKFGEVRTLSLIGIPKSVNKNQKLIFDYMEESDDD